MKILRLAPLAALAFTLSLGQAQEPKPAPSQPQPWKKIPIPPLHDFKPVQPRRVDLPNGLVLFLQEDHELPFISGTVLIRGGSQDEPAAKVGLVRLYGRTWRTSGTATTSGDALDDSLAAKAATIETSGGNAVTTLSWSCLKGDFDSVFASSMDLLLHPAFKADKLQLAKRGTTASIARRNDDAAGIASREAVQLVYGKDSPYARQVEYATIAAVTLEDLQAWHDRTVIPNDMIVALEGDFDSAAMEARMREAFGSLKPGTAFPKENVAIPPAHPGVYFANKSDVDQSNVYLAGLGTERRNPDFYALSVMNEVFSGGFGSRVFQSVRTRLGLAYSVGGSFGAGYDHPGLFVTGAATKSQSTVAATEAMLAEIGRLKTDPPTPAEMSAAKDKVLNAFIFNYDSPEKTLNEQVTLAFYGYPPDFLDKYKDGIEKVTSADVSRVANKYIDASKLAIVVVGNQSEFGTPLSKLGPVTKLDISIPPPPPKTPQNNGPPPKTVILSEASCSFTAGGAVEGPAVPLPGNVCPDLFTHGSYPSDNPLPLAIIQNREHPSQPPYGIKMLLPEIACGGPGEALTRTTKTSATPCSINNIQKTSPISRGKSAVKWLSTSTHSFPTTYA